MIKKGEEALEKFSTTAYPKAINQVAKGIYHVTGYGHSNAIVIEGERSLILIDTLDSNERAKKMMTAMRKYTDKPVKTIIFTHGHPDHRGGSGAFKETVTEIIAFSNKQPVLKHTALLADVFEVRGKRQFGYALNDEEALLQGIGIREGKAVNDGKYDFLAPTEVLTADQTERVIDGIHLTLVAAPGETGDTGFIWLKEQGILCCGDNYYGCWPNLSAIRGGQYRDVAEWVDSLDKIMSYDAEIVLPGHTKALIGKAQVTEVLGNFRNAINEVLLQTLQGMNEGKAVDEVVACVQLPAHLQHLPYLGEYYGTIEWTVKAIYYAYLGWYDGNPTNLHRLNSKAYAHKMLALIGSKEKVYQEIEQALASGTYQWALELSDLLIQVEDKKGDLSKIAALRKQAPLETSANSRHYYLAYANDLEKN
ncbi:alkyl/aryl-sulfatase [Isobaculum melis]|uniref:Metallo-beta-lactamase superfamily protein n=1 Tax=Isobaculum melis TaxID=142588 RepID=A0A1H9Q4M3_9LACT|nr:alkyl/aryl-sulfatase [Isobaculum melis]SER54889.1 Metallo-beta-lactamase superfamily protein [Isobaculum melis]